MLRDIFEHQIFSTVLMLLALPQLTEREFIRSHLFKTRPTFYATISSSIHASKTRTFDFQCPETHSKRTSSPNHRSDD